MQTTNKQRRKGLHRVPEQSAGGADQPAKTLTIELPSDADLEALQAPQGRQLTMFERLCTDGGWNGKPRAYERATVAPKEPWLIALTDGRDKYTLRYWLERKLVLRRGRKRVAEEDTWDWTQDT